MCCLVLVCFLDLYYDVFDVILGCFFCGPYSLKGFISIDFDESTPRGKSVGFEDPKIFYNRLQ